MSIFVKAILPLALYLCALAIILLFFAGASRAEFAHTDEDPLPSGADLDAVAAERRAREDTDPFADFT